MQRQAVIRRSSAAGASCSGRPAVCARSLVTARPRPAFAAAPRAAAAADKDAADAAPSSSSESPEDALRRTTEKYGLEAGLLQVATSKPAAASEDGSPALTRTQQAKQLLAQYGGAYLLTSISFALVSFAACYAAVSAGVDVRSLLARVGLQASDASEKVGTFAIAYAAHKALSPVRFPPTVALTPVVAKWIGQQRRQEGAEGEGGNSGGGGSSK